MPYEECRMFTADLDTLLGSDLSEDIELDHNVMGRLWKAPDDALARQGLTGYEVKIEGGTLPDTDESPLYIIFAVKRLPYALVEHKETAVMPSNDGTIDMIESGNVYRKGFMVDEEPIRPITLEELRKIRAAVREAIGEPNPYL
jgi:hypothetical protein